MCMCICMYVYIMTVGGGSTWHKKKNNIRKVKRCQPQLLPLTINCEICFSKFLALVVHVFSKKKKTRKIIIRTEKVGVSWGNNFSERERGPRNKLRQLPLGERQSANAAKTWPTRMDQNVHNKYTYTHTHTQSVVYLCVSVCSGTCNFHFGQTIVYKRLTEHVFIFVLALIRAILSNAFYKPRNCRR